uniref:katanin p80 WD40 repeat-containing subunit B1 homolog KTN80.1-like isoform X2 n=1 Tax=Erigeron canadensis TaxID=72917 RepID=UPI001CB8E19A|nr:katanin p80 WD40 repeat-containing subunit B1 homolog KTN80.1-like isoform X2 [Erigeron canadensis]
MAKRGYKLQEFVAHSANVNCVKFGKKTRRRFVTGGDDEMVNLWTIGKSTSITSLSGHTSPIESVAFDSTEVLVAAGASSGVVKLWDLEETKVVRTLNGHRSYCTAVEFHPFGEFFASGSMDTNLKIWDIRKKGCIHTFKGHKRAISTIKFTPDGRWVVSGGLDNVVKIWDLTAGKLLHEFKFHEGHIRSMDFHPLEFLLATGSSDKTVKFWDLETFELIGSTRAEETTVRSITFHPDGRTLFCGLDNSLKVYSWEPMCCHDGVDIRWPTLGDLCIDDGKLLGCSYYQNSIGVWASDVSQIEPYRHSMSSKGDTRAEPNIDTPRRSFIPSDDDTNPRRSVVPPDNDTKDIKNIYVDSMSLNLTNTKETDILQLPKHVLATEKIRHDNPETMYSVTSRRDLVVDGSITSGASCKPLHRRRPSSTKSDIEEISARVEFVPNSGSATPTTTTIQRRLFVDDLAKDSLKVKTPTTCVAGDFDKYLSPRTLPKKNSDLSADSNKGLKPIKYVNGVAVVNGRTRSLVDKFEKGDKSDTNECQKGDLTAHILPNTDNVPPTTVEESISVVSCAMDEARTPMSSETAQSASNAVSEARSSSTEHHIHNVVSRAIPEATTLPMPVRIPDSVPCAQPMIKISQISSKTPDMVSSSVIDAKTSPTFLKTRDSYPEINSEEAKSSPVSIVRTPKTSPNMVHEKVKVSPIQKSVASRRVVHDKVRSSSMLVTRRSRASSYMIPERNRTPPQSVVPRHDSSPHMMTNKTKSSPYLDSPQTSGRCISKCDDDDADVEDLLLDHELFTSTLRSRLTKLQVVRNFWQQNDLRGAINALQKLPDHAVQADVTSVMLENVESLTLDLFSCLLPLLLGLLNSETERHINVSLEMLLKLVAVFGPVIASTISAPPAIGVNLQAEKRLECCSQCHAQLQKIQKSLPGVIRRGGLTARSAQELNLVLQQS